MATTSSSSSSFQHKTPNNSGGNRAFLTNGCLFVGNLHPSVTESDLYDLFSHVASVVSISIRRSRKGETTANYGFVNLQDSQQASNAMRRLNYTPINGKPIRIGPSYINRTINLIVKNLDASIDDKSLHDTFADFGNIISCQVAKDRSGQSKRYGFVQFEDEKAAHDAIKGLNGFLIKDKPLSVNLFIQSEQRNLVIGTQKVTKVYVRNFSEATSEEDLRETFGKFGPVTRANVIRDANGKSRFFGFVSFQNPDDAAVAVENVNGVVASDGKVWHVEKAMGRVKRKCLWQDKPGLEGNEYLRGGRVNGGSLNRASSEFGSATSVKAQDSQETVNAVPFPLAQNSQEPTKVVPFASDIRRFCAVGPKLTPQLLTFLQQPYPWIRPAVIPNFVAVCPQHQMVKSNANQGFMQVPNVVDTYVVPQMPLNVSYATVLSTKAPQFGPAPLSKLPYAVAPAVLQHPQHFMQADGNQRFLYLSNAWNMVNPLLVPPWPTSPMPFNVSVTHVPPVAVPLPVPVSFCLFMRATSQRPRIVLGKEVSPLLERLKHANIRHLNRSPRNVFFSGKTISIASADPKRIVLNHHQNSATIFHQNRSNFSMITKHSTEGEEEIEICTQGSAKTELCNKWEKNGSCPYGDKCTFAHGIHELRPVLRKPKFKTDLCREFRSGGTCRYGYRCHFRHSLEPEKMASAKVTKHEKACIDNQHVFIPFAFDTFGFLAPDAVEFLKRVQRVMHSNVMSPRSMDVVFKRIGFAIQKGLAAQLVARLPSISM